MPPYLGGHAIAAISWEGPFALAVRFETTYDDLCHQFYVGRSLVGWTDSIGDRQILCNVQDSLWPEHCQLLAVDPTQRATDYGALLPPRPYNRVKLIGDTTGWTDAKFLEVVAGTEPGGAVDTDNVIALELFDTGRERIIITDPLPGSGPWNFELAGRDLTRPDGNRGDPTAVSASIYAHSPDVEYLDDGYSRLQATSNGTNLTVTFTEPTE